MHCYLEVSIAHGTPLADAARFRMNGTIKLGQRWVRFRARRSRLPTMAGPSEPPHRVIKGVIGMFR